MALGTSLFLLALGAILAFAVTATVQGVDITLVGFILMIIGGIGLLLSLMVPAFSGRGGEDVIVDEEAPARRTTYRR